VDTLIRSIANGIRAISGVKVVTCNRRFLSIRVERRDDRWCIPVEMLKIYVEPRS
jgi:hypothetical protein